MIISDFVSEEKPVIINRPVTNTRLIMADISFSLLLNPILFIFVILLILFNKPGSEPDMATAGNEADEHFSPILRRAFIYISLSPLLAIAILSQQISLSDLITEDIHHVAG